MDELIRKLANDYIQQYVKRTGKNPTSDLVANVVGMVKRDIQTAMEQGMTYEQMYAKSFKDSARTPGQLNNAARAAGQAYELMSTPEMRSAAAGELNGAGRGQISPDRIAPGFSPVVGAGRGRVTPPTAIPHASGYLEQVIPTFTGY